MRLIVEGVEFVDPPVFASGGEAEICELDSSQVAKVYFEDIRTDERKQKVLALCNSYSNFNNKYSSQLIAFPQSPAYELTISFDTLVGFSMAKYACPVLQDVAFNLASGVFQEASGVRFDDRTAIQFIYDLCASVEQLHQTRIVLGDINPANILCDPVSLKPVIIDIDAAQIGGFPCRTTHPFYNDPELDNRGKGLGGTFTFDFRTDVFALAVVCFEFFIGVRPHQLYVTPPRKDTENKTDHISSIRCYKDGNDYLAGYGIKYFSCPENEAIERRIRTLEKLDSRLFTFFYSVFVRGERDNVLFSLPLTDSRHPGFHFFVDSGFKGAIDKELKKRKQRADVQARQGARAIPVPDAGFANVVGTILGKHVAKSSVGLKRATPRKDPDALADFLQQFDLRMGA